MWVGLNVSYHTIEVALRGLLQFLWRDEFNEKVADEFLQLTNVWAIQNVYAKEVPSVTNVN